MFHPLGAWVHDVWFARADDVHHAFYLQAPSAIGNPDDWKSRHALQLIGHAVSTDLESWTDCGPVIAPIAGSWRTGIATGSVVRRGERWWMFFTSRCPSGAGVGVATSPDLYTWQVEGDSPVIGSEVFTSSFDGEDVTWQFLADPYVYPEPVDGLYYMIVNGQVCGQPAAERGCLGLLVSEDLRSWSRPRLLSWPRAFTRMETPCLWRANGRWCLYFGAVVETKAPPEACAAIVPDALAGKPLLNGLLLADDIAGPYRPAPHGLWDTLPDGRMGYIYKFLPGSDGSDLLLTTHEHSLLPPYRVDYAADGSLVIRTKL